MKERVAVLPNLHHRTNQTVDRLQAEDCFSTQAALADYGVV